MPAPKKKLGELLVDAGVLDEQQLRQALNHQRQWGGKLGQVLVDLRLASEPQIVTALSAKLGYDVAPLDQLHRNPTVDAALKLVPREVARRHGVLPLASDQGSLTVAMSDPTNIAVVDELAFRTGRRVRIVIAGDREVARAVTRLCFPEESLDARGLELADARPGAVPNRSYDALADHVQERYFRSSLREVSEDTLAAEPSSDPEPPAAPAETPLAAPPATVSTASQAARESALRDAIDAMARGEEPPGGLRSTRLVAALARAMIRRGLVTEAELVLELTQPKR